VHHLICASGRLREFLSRDLIPWTLDGATWAGRVLEIGPGPGLTTELLAPRTKELVCIERDWGLAEKLRGRHGAAVRVLCGDATSMGLESNTFDTVLAFTMLHHVTPRTAQDNLFHEVARVLRPGGLFAGVDSLDNPIFRMLHWFDDLELVSPETLENRLLGAGFERAEISVRKRDFRFRAWRNLN
ncbi:MAG: methyltransferase domain-containing protein, partial [Bryobacterales bacterium]|nr:methyltransferase domain-containing protein [Bryobacterales bacterium]